MREIKFRAWDKYEKRYRYFTLKDLVNDLGFDYGMECDLVGLSNEVNYEQFTGLLDKNGKEIYEGDVLCGLFGTAGRGALRRKEKPFLFLIAYYRCSFVEHRIGDTGNYRYYPNWNECEVIGNIYENPDLLEPTN